MNAKKASSTGRQPLFWPRAGLMSRRVHGLLVCSPFQASSVLHWAGLGRAPVSESETLAQWANGTRQRRASLCT